jgi:hypothetical protein
MSEEKPRKDTDMPKREPPKKKVDRGLRDTIKKNKAD